MGGKKGGGLFENWFKNFTITVFTQSFHAFFLLFVMKMLSEISKIRSTNSKTDMILALMSIVGMMAIIKFEKLIKQLFGISDSMAGDFKGAGAKLLMAMKSAGDIGKTIGTPIANRAKANRRVGELGRKMAASGNFVGADGKSPFVMGQHAQLKSDLQGQNLTGPITSDSSNLQVNGNVTASANELNSGAASLSTNAETNKLLQQLVTISQNKVAEEKSDKNKKMLEDYTQAVRDSKVATRDSIANLVTSTASMSVGLGMFDELSESITAANLINKPLAYGTTKGIEYQEDRRAYKATGDDKYYRKSMGEAIQPLTNAIKEFKDMSLDQKAKKITVDHAKSAISITNKVITGNEPRRKNNNKTYVTNDISDT